MADEGTPRVVGADSGDRVRTFRILRRLAHRIRHANDIGPVLELALDSALAMVDAEIGALSYADMSTQRYILAASRGLSDAYVKEITTWSLHEGLAGQAFGLREPLTVTDLGVNRDVARGIVREEHLRGYVCVPLLRGPKRLGIIEVFDREPRAFTVEDVETLEMVAAFVSSVVEGLVIVDELRFLREERAQVLRQWTTQALTAADAQRRELTRRLLEEADDLDSAVSGDGPDAATRLRQLAEELTETATEWVDMVPLVREAITERWSGHTGKQVVLDLGHWPASLPLELTTRLYLLMHSLVQSATTASQSEVTLQLGGAGDQMWVQVCDDRLRTPGADTLTELSAEVTATIRGLTGSLQSAVDAHAPGCSRAPHRAVADGTRAPCSGRPEAGYAEPRVGCRTRDLPQDAAEPSDLDLPQIGCHQPRTGHAVPLIQRPWEGSHTGRAASSYGDVHHLPPTVVACR